MSEPVVVYLEEHLVSEWWFNCLHAMDIYRPGLSYDQQIYILRQWFDSRYQAKINIERDTNVLTFPDQERYLECMLTWS